MIKSACEVIGVLLVIGLIASVIMGTLKISKDEVKMKAELFNKYPECLQACKPIMCIRYKREIERLGL